MQGQHSSQGLKEKRRKAYLFTASGGRLSKGICAGLQEARRESLAESLLHAAAEGVNQHLFPTASLPSAAALLDRRTIMAGFKGRVACFVCGEPALISGPAAMRAFRSANRSARTAQA
jgi:hypothetical protein